MNMDDSDNFPFDEDGKLLTRSQCANERYDQLQAEQAQRATNVVAEFVQPDHATGEQPSVEDRQRQWVFTQVITVLQIDRLTNPRLHSYVASEVIQEIDTSQTGNLEDIAMALIAQADARYDARQATAPEAATADSNTTTGDVPQAEANTTTGDLTQAEANAASSDDAVPQAGVTTSLRERANEEILRRNEVIRSSLRLDRYQAQDRLPMVTADGTSGDLLAAYRTKLQQEEMTADIARLNEADNPDTPCTCSNCVPSLNETDQQDITQLRRGGLNGPEPVRYYIHCPCPDCADCADDM
jgi:hypothetical protein